MAAILNEYELSIWKDVWARPTLLDEKGNVLYTLNGSDVLDEEKSAILSTDNFTFPGKAINIIFKTKINGTHELTFDLPGKYVDPTTGKKIKNYLRDLLDNETKIKLKYKDEWYSFYVKKVTEKRDKNNMQYSYTCSDSFIVELSKTGYKITFNEYSEHYVEQIHEFAEDILDGSEWDYDKKTTQDNCDLVEYQEEKVVIYKLKDNATIYKLKLKSNDSKLYEAEFSNQNRVVVTFPNGGYIYGFYSEYGQEVKDIYGHGTGERNAVVKQVFYVPDDKYEISGNTVINKDCYYLVKVTDIASNSIDDDFESPLDKYVYGLRVCYNPYTEYCKELDRYVKRYTNSSTPENIFSYTKSHVMVPEIAKNCAANARDMTDTTGWAPQYAKDKLIVGRTDTGEWGRDENGFPVLIGDDIFSRSPDTYSIIAENLTAMESNLRIINTGPYSKKIVIDAPTTYALRINYKWCKRTNNIGLMQKDRKYMLLLMIILRPPQKVLELQLNYADL